MEADKLNRWFLDSIDIGKIDEGTWIAMTWTWHETGETEYMWVIDDQS